MRKIKVSSLNWVKDTANSLAEILLYYCKTSHFILLCLSLHWMGFPTVRLHQVKVSLEEVEDEGLLISWSLSKQPSFSLTVSPCKLQRQVRTFDTDSTLIWYASEGLISEDRSASANKKANKRKINFELCKILFYFIFCFKLLSDSVNKSQAICMWVTVRPI